MPRKRVALGGHEISGSLLDHVEVEVAHVVVLDHGTKLDTKKITY